MADQCAAPDCTNSATTGPLCYVCEGQWMRDRREVVEQADQLTTLAAEFAEWCRTHGQPDPYHD